MAPAILLKQWAVFSRFDLKRRVDTARQAIQIKVG